MGLILRLPDSVQRIEKAAVDSPPSSRPPPLSDAGLGVSMGRVSCHSLSGSTGGAETTPLTPGRHQGPRLSYPIPPHSSVGLIVTSRVRFDRDSRILGVVRVVCKGLWWGGHVEGPLSGEGRKRNSDPTPVRTRSPRTENYDPVGAVGRYDHSGERDHAPQDTLAVQLNTKFEQWFH